MKEKISFDDQISRNKAKSVFLMIIIFFVFILLGYLISFLFDPGYFFVVMSISVIFSLTYILFSYYNAHKIALASVGAEPASEREYRQLHNAVENMAIAAGLPKPKVYVMKSEEINALASGRNPENAVICVTTGALKKLNKEELEGVISHEMAHIANYDVRFMTLATIMIGLIAIISEIFLRSFWFSNRDSRDRTGALILLASILVAILAPILAQLISLAISRSREYTADATGVKFTRYPAGLANALKKIKYEHVSSDELKRYPKEVAPLFISDPFKKKVSSLFMTHPPIEERIRRLEAM